MSDENRPEIPKHLLSRLGILQALGWCLASALLQSLLVAGLDALRPGAEDNLFTLALADVASVLITIFAMLQVHGKEVDPSVFVGLRKLPILRVVSSLVAGVALAPLVERLTVKLRLLDPPSASDVARTEHMFAGDTIKARVVVALSLMVLIPVAEELLFRGALYERLRKHTSRTTAAVSVTLMSVVGYLPALRSYLPALLVAALAGLVRARTGSLASSIAMQVGYAGCAVVPFLIRPDAEIPTGIRVLVGSGIGLALMLFATCAQAPVDDTEDTAANGRGKKDALA